ncbi:MAG: PspC domain-containing protein [Flavobacteriales bacterium]|nr:PspC domain-containing protein [Flavobacteriales bacterium]
MSRRNLKRDQQSRVIAGVCSGLGKYFNLDPILFRALFLLLLFAGGGGVLLYLILWMVLPMEGLSFPNYEFRQSTFEKDETAQPTIEDEDESTNIPLGLLLLSAGILLLVNNLVPDFRILKMWPLILIIVGGGLVFSRKDFNSKDKTAE